MGKITMTELRINNLRRRAYLAIVALCILAFLPSCSKSNIVYYKFHEVKNNKWSKQDTLVYTVDPILFETGVPYKVSIDLVNGANYPYQNIWFYIQHNLEDSTGFKKEAVQYNVSDEYGKWHGAGFGSLYQLPLVYKDTVVFKDKRPYQFRILQGMRDEPLVGINKVGIRVQKL